MADHQQGRGAADAASRATLIARAARPRLAEARSRASELDAIQRSAAGDLDAAVSRAARSCTSIADAPPGDGFEPVEADLEDVYFAAIAGASRRARGRAA